MPWWLAVANPLFQSGPRGFESRPRHKQAIGAGGTVTAGKLNRAGCPAPLGTRMEPFRGLGIVPSGFRSGSS